LEISGEYFSLYFHEFSAEEWKVLKEWYAEKERGQKTIGLPSLVVPEKEVLANKHQGGKSKR